MGISSSYFLVQFYCEFGEDFSEFTNSSSTFGLKTHISKAPLYITQTLQYTAFNEILTPFASEAISINKSKASTVFSIEYKILFLFCFESSFYSN